MTKEAMPRMLCRLSYTTLFRTRFDFNRTAVCFYYVAFPLYQ